MEDRLKIFLPTPSTIPLPPLRHSAPDPQCVEISNGSNHPFQRKTLVFTFETVTRKTLLTPTGGETDIPKYLFSLATNGVEGVKGHTQGTNF